jgi:hypothetical protein
MEFEIIIIYTHWIPQFGNCLDIFKIIYYSTISRISQSSSVAPKNCIMAGSNLLILPTSFLFHFLNWWKLGDQKQQKLLILWLKSYPWKINPFCWEWKADEIIKLFRNQYKAVLKFTSKKVKYHVQKNTWEWHEYKNTTVQTPLSNLTSCTPTTSTSYSVNSLDSIF